jgi:magnesium transporter
LVLRQLKVDPAVVSAPLITTLVDGTGLLIYLSIARYTLDAI